MEILTVYDIADPKRLRRVACVMQRFGVRVQKSVFECDLADTARRDMLERVGREMDREVDGVRVYPLLSGSRSKQIILGRGRPVQFPQAYIL